MSIKAISLFSGGGGLDLGFSATGFDIVYATDIDPYSCETLRLNQGRKPYYSKHLVEATDIKNLDPFAILHELNISQSEVNFILGGPPCQAFSVFGRRKGLDDPRGNLVYEYARIIKELKPEGFLFENVSGLKTIHNGDLYNNLIETLSFGGEYTVSAHEYDVANYGIPQFRSRVIIIGSRNGIKVSGMPATYGDPNSNPGLLPYKIVKQVLEGMPDPSENIIYNHIGREHSQRIIDRYRGLEFGERDPLTRINKLHPARPSYTIIVGSDKGGGKGHVHPYFPREVTPRESARLQTFPDWWEFASTGRHVIRQVGNAVPPLFAALLAEHIKTEIFNLNDNVGYDNLLKKLDLPFLNDNN
jgi:DNA (cytosine-5)-methyltransferase 1